MNTKSFAELCKKKHLKRLIELSSRIERLERVIIISAGVIITSMGGIIISLLTLLLK
jgi:hypothetical protein